MAMQSFRTVPIRLLLSTEGVEFGRYCADEFDRCAIYEDAILWKPEDGCVFKSLWLRGESEACSEADARDGDSGDVPWDQYQSALHEARGLSVSLKKSFDRTFQSRLECRYNVHSSVERVCVSGGDYGLVFPIRVGFSDIQQSGDDLLSRGARRGVGYRDARYFQYGSGVSVYKRRFYRTAKKERDQNQHGWARESLRQYFCGAALEECEVRGYLQDEPLPTVRKDIKRWPRQRRV